MTELDISDSSIKHRAKVIFGLIIVLGVVLSGFVYTSTNSVKKQTLQLVDHEIPIYAQLQALDSSFTEQERYLYEYYATQERALYQVGFLKAATNTHKLLLELKQANISPSSISALEIIQNEIEQLAIEFDSYMFAATSGEEWELARTHLKMFSDFRRRTSPMISSILADTNLRVQQQYQNTQSSLEITSIIVVAYSLLIVILSIFMGRYIAKYIVISARSKRLALFPTRNPNAILSLDSSNEIKFYNPATERLLEELELDFGAFSQQLISYVTEYQSQVLSNNCPHTRFEFLVQDKTMDCELHWLGDNSGWDIHLIDITLRKKAEERVNYQAYHELHTGLFNKNKLYEVLEQHTAQQKSFALGAIEIRQYSQLVASQGVEVTGNIVRQLAETLNDLFSDTLLDIGYMLFQTSDKDFSLLLQTDYSESEILLLVQMIETHLEKQCFTNEQRIELDFGFCCSPRHANNKSSIVKCVNIALEEALQSEHTSVIVYSEELGNRLEKEIVLTERLRQAIANKDLELYFQPQLDIQLGEVVGVETLIRWSTSDGFISPAEFIPLAEKSGLIIPLGDWILEHACIKAKQLFDAGYDDLVVAINISPQQFKHPEFLSLVQNVLAQTQVPAKNIELEITEGVIMYNEADTIAALQRLKDTGVMLSIDDFGTGYSSLSYLKQFPIDKLKIDQSFVRHLQEDDADKAIVRTVIDLGSHLELRLIAEGVEHQVQLELLKAMGCQEIQGYYFSKPLCSSDLDNFLNGYSDIAIITA